MLIIITMAFHIGIHNNDYKLTSLRSITNFNISVGVWGIWTHSNIIRIIAGNSIIMILPTTFSKLLHV